MVVQVAVAAVAAEVAATWEEAWAGSLVVLVVVAAVVKVAAVALEEAVVAKVVLVAEAVTSVVVLEMVEGMVVAPEIHMREGKIRCSNLFAACCRNPCN